MAKGKGKKSRTADLDSMAQVARLNPAPPKIQVAANVAERLSRPMKVARPPQRSNRYRYLEGAGYLDTAVALAGGEKLAGRQPSIARAAARISNRSKRAMDAAGVTVSTVRVRPRTPSIVIRDVCTVEPQSSRIRVARVAGKLSSDPKKEPNGK